MTHALPFLLCLAGFTALALATKRQQDALFPRPLPRTLTRKLRIGGASFLLLALAVQATQQGWGLGLVLFSGHSSATAGLVYCALIVGGRRAAD